MIDVEECDQIPHNPEEETTKILTPPQSSQAKSSLPLSLEFSENPIT